MADPNSKGKSVLLQSSGRSDPAMGRSMLPPIPSTDFPDSGLTETTKSYSPASSDIQENESFNMPKESFNLHDNPFGRHIEEPTGRKTILVDDNGGNFCCGWLLVVSGPMKGNAHQINIGRNSVGRDVNNVVRLMNDDAISRDAQVYVIYDADYNEYAITPGNGSAISRLNGQRLDATAALKHGDIISLSKKTSLRFIPACDEQFTWEIAE